MAIIIIITTSSNSTLSKKFRLYALRFPVAVVYLAFEEEVHPVPVEEALAVGGGLVGHVPHRRPGRLHHVVADTSSQLHQQANKLNGPNLPTPVPPSGHSILFLFLGGGGYF